MAKFLKRLFKKSDLESEVESKPVSRVKSDTLTEEQKAEQRLKSIDEMKQQLKSKSNEYIDSYMNRETQLDASSDIEALDEMLLKPDGYKGYMPENDAYEYLCGCMEEDRFITALSSAMVDNKNADVIKVNVQCPEETVGHVISSKPIGSGEGAYHPLEECSTDTFTITFKRNDRGDFDIASVNPTLSPEMEPTGRDLSQLLDKCPNYIENTTKPCARVLCDMRTSPNMNRGVSYLNETDTLYLDYYKDVFYTNFSSSNLYCSYKKSSNGDDIFRKGPQRYNGMSGKYPQDISLNILRRENDEGVQKFVDAAELLDSSYDKVMHSKDFSRHRVDRNPIIDETVRIGSDIKSNSDYISARTAEVDVSLY